MRTPKRPDGLFCQFREGDWNFKPKETCDVEGWLRRCLKCGQAICDKHWERHRRQR